MLVETEKIDPRVRRTRQLLQNAMMQLMQEKSLESITVQDIAARAGVNRATFYAHFEDKNALLNHMVREMFQMRLDAKLPQDPALTTDSLRLLIVTTCEYMGEIIGHCAPVTHMNEHAMMFIQVQVHLRELVQDWLHKSGAGTAVPETVALTTSWAIWGSVFQWAREGSKIPAARLTEQILTQLQSGLQQYLTEEVRA